MNRLEFSNDEDNGQKVFDFMFEIYQTNKYAEFSKGLDDLMEHGVKIHGVGLLSSILYLFSRGGAKEASEDILNMFEIALFEYDVFDDVEDLVVTDEEDFDDVVYALTTVDYIRVELPIDYGAHIQVGDEAIERVRKCIFEYIRKKLDRDKIQSLSLDKQHTMLLTQFPYYDEVNKLMELGCQFDKAFDYGIHYENVFHYIAEIGVNKKYGAFRNSEAPTIYEFLSLILEHQLGDDTDKREVYWMLHQFKDKLLPKELEKLIVKLKVNYSKQLSLRYAKYGNMSDVQILSTFIKTIIHDRRYSDFRHELDQIIEMGVDLSPSCDTDRLVKLGIDQNSPLQPCSLLYFILVQIENPWDENSPVEMAKIFEIVLFEYHINPLKIKNRDDIMLYIEEFDKVTFGETDIKKMVAAFYAS